MGLKEKGIGEKIVNSVLNITVDVLALSIWCSDCFSYTTMILYSDQPSPLQIWKGMSFKVISNKKWWIALNQPKLLIK